jgi:hypothetical protein
MAINVNGASDALGKFQGVRLWLRGDHRDGGDLHTSVPNDEMALVGNPATWSEWAASFSNDHPTRISSEGRSSWVMDDPSMKVAPFSA